MPNFFWVVGCPDEANCSEPAWKRAQCWGWSEEEARKQLVGHLCKSSLHAMEPEDAKGLAELAEIKEDEWEGPLPGGNEGRKRKATDPAALVAETIRQLGAGGSKGK